MTLKDLVSNKLVKDTDKITIAKPLSGNAADMRKGTWFDNQVLDFLNAEIKAFSWDEENGYSVALKGEE